MVRQLLVSIPLLIFVQCSDLGVDPPSTAPSALIVVKVHWGEQGISGIPIVLLGRTDTVRTDPSGLAEFHVPPGKYVVRAMDVNRGGPVFRYVDVDVNAIKGRTSFVDIIDCLACL